MKWPIVETTTDRSKQIVRIEYMTRTTEFIIDTTACKLCRQCIKVCPQDVLIQKKFPRGTKVDRVERVPFLENPVKCVFCGVCMTMCPFDAIEMRLDEKKLETQDLILSKAGKLPVFTSLKIAKVELADPNFKGAFWEKILDKITIKKKTPAVP